MSKTKTADAAEILAYHKIGDRISVYLTARDALTLHIALNERADRLRGEGDYDRMVESMKLADQFYDIWGENVR